MICNEFWNGEEHPRDHLAECPACAARMARHQEVAAGLNTLGRQMRRIEAPARVERALVSAFRGDAMLGGGESLRESRASWWLAGAWAVALAATVLLAIVLLRPHEPERTRRLVRSRTQLAAAEQTFEGAELQAASDADSVESGFLQLPNAEAVGPNDDIDVVRIELPRSAMIPLGYAVPAERAAELVQADVMLDGDGVARAVRFVDSEKLVRESSW